MRAHISDLARRPRTLAQLEAARRTGAAKKGKRLGPLSDRHRTRISRGARRAYAKGTRKVTIDRAIAAAADLRRGQKLPSEWIAKCSAARRGKKLSIAHRRAISVGLVKTLRANPRHLSAERRAEIGRNSKRVWSEMSLAQRAARVRAGRSGWARLSDEQRHRRIGPAQQAAGRTHPTNLEKIVEALLRVLRVTYIQQHRIGRYLVDFYLPEYRLVVECDGEYWHRNSAWYNRTRDHYMRGLGYRVCRLAEEVIKSDKVQNMLSTKLRSVC